jgi:hypothetical protein
MKKSPNFWFFSIHPVISFRMSLMDVDQSAGPSLQSQQIENETDVSLKMAKLG